jgi:hypothetical protein
VHVLDDQVAVGIDGQLDVRVPEDPLYVLHGNLLAHEQGGCGVALMPCAA